MLNGQELWKSRRKTFILGFATSIKSTVAISKELLTCYNFKFILTYKFSQGALELYLVMLEVVLGIMTIQVVFSLNMLFEVSYYTLL